MLVINLPLHIKTVCAQLKIELASWTVNCDGWLQWTVGVCVVIIWLLVFLALSGMSPFSQITAINLVQCTVLLLICFTVVYFDTKKPSHWEVSFNLKPHEALNLSGKEHHIGVMPRCDPTSVRSLSESLPTQEVVHHNLRAKSKLFPKQQWGIVLK